MKDILIGDIKTNVQGDSFEILEDLNPTSLLKNKLYKIRFLKTGNIYEIPAQRVRASICSVADSFETEKIFKATIWPQNCGDSLKILKKTDKKGKDKSFLWEVEFLKYPYKKIAHKSHILEGKVFNPYCPNKQGFYLGGEFKNLSQDLNYKIWNHLQLRERSNYAKVGVNFKNFKYFNNWCNANRYNCNYFLELDKDLLFNILNKQNKIAEKIYSENTCLFIPSELNGFLISDTWLSHVNLYKNAKTYKYNACIRFSNFSFRQKGDSFKELKDRISQIKYQLWQSLIEKYQLPESLKSILLQYDFSWKWIWENMTEEEIYNKYYINQ